MAGEIDQKALEHLNTHVLAHGETIQWTGRPDPRKAMRIFGPYPYILGGIVLLFATMSSAMVLVDWISHPARANPFFLLVGFGLMGFALFVMATPRRALAQARRLCYAITDRRVLIISADRTGFSTTIIDPRMIYAIKQTQHADGTGDIELSPPRSLTGSLWGIADPHDAHEAIMRLLRK